MGWGELRGTGRGRLTLLLVALALLGSLAGCTLLGSESSPPADAPDFQLTDQRGNAFRMSDLEGTPAIVTFVYTSCPDICPLYLFNIKSALAELDPTDSAAFAVVVITVDPDRDTVELLSEYANAWPSGWRFLTGAPTTLSRVWSDYGIFVNRVIDTATGRDGQDKYEVIHNGRAIVIDAEGKIAGEVRSRWTSPELQQALEAVLAGGLPANAGRADLNPIQAFLDRCGEFASENPQAFLGIVLLVMLPGLVLPFFLLRWIFASGNPTEG